LGCRFVVEEVFGDLYKSCSEFSPFTSAMVVFVNAVFYFGHGFYEMFDVIQMLFIGSFAL
jgi:hypothetical protein